nr:hypothetical protein [Ruegeria sp. AU67]
MFRQNQPLLRVHIVSLGIQYLYQAASADGELGSRSFHAFGVGLGS